MCCSFRTITVSYDFGKFNAVAHHLAKFNFEQNYYFKLNESFSTQMKGVDGLCVCFCLLVNECLSVHQGLS